MAAGQRQDSMPKGHSVRIAWKIFKRPWVSSTIWETMDSAFKGPSGMDQRRRSHRGSIVEQRKRTVQLWLCPFSMRLGRCPLKSHLRKIFGMLMRKSCSTRGLKFIEACIAKGTPPFLKDCERLPCGQWLPLAKSEICFVDGCCMVCQKPRLHSTFLLLVMLSWLSFLVNGSLIWLMRQ